MITAGIDVGSKNIKVVVLDSGTVVSRVSVSASFDQEESARVAIEKAAASVGIAVEGFDYIAATGVGRKSLPFAGHHLTEVAADARGAVHLVPDVRTIIDVGAEEARAVRVDERGKVIDFAVNEKCAAGAGAFVEAMSRALELELGEFGRISLESTESIPMNAQCTVFAESEVVSLIHANTAQKDIARAVHDAMAGRVSAMARRAGLEAPVVLVGGVAKNVGFVRSLEDTLGVGSLRVAPDADFVGALGAALAASDKVTEVASAGGSAGEGE
jgi:benzoyl-CoA reductase subunit D